MPAFNLTPAQRRVAARVHAMPDPPIHLVDAYGSWWWHCPCGAWAAHVDPAAVERAARAHRYAERPLQKAAAS